MRGHRAEPPEGMRGSEYVAKCAVCGGWIYLISGSWDGKRKPTWRHAPGERGPE